MGGPRGHGHHQYVSLSTHDDAAGDEVPLMSPGERKRAAAEREGDGEEEEWGENQWRRRRPAGDVAVGRQEEVAAENQESVWPHWMVL